MLKFWLVKFQSPGPNMALKCPTLGSYSVIKWPFSVVFKKSLVEQKFAWFGNAILTYLTHQMKHASLEDPFHNSDGPEKGHHGEQLGKLSTFRVSPNIPCIFWAIRMVRGIYKLVKTFFKWAEGVLHMMSSDTELRKCLTP